MKYRNLLRKCTLERVLAIALRIGTTIACFVVGAGLILGLFPALRTIGEGLGKIGVAIFISLPILRVSIMIIAFFKHRDFVFAAISMTVLAVIGAGAALGVVLANVAP